MQEKESVMVVRCEEKNSSLGITVWHHEALPTVTIRTEYPLKILVLLQRYIRIGLGFDFTAVGVKYSVAVVLHPSTDFFFFFFFFFFVCLPGDHWAILAGILENRVRLKLVLGRGHKEEGRQ